MNSNPESPKNLCDIIEVKELASPYGTAKKAEIEISDVGFRNEYVFTDDNFYFVHKGIKNSVAPTNPSLPY